MDKTTLVMANEGGPAGALTGLAVFRLAQGSVSVCGCGPSKQAFPVARRKMGELQRTGAKQAWLVSKAQKTAQTGDWCVDDCKAPKN